MNVQELAVNKRTALMMFWNAGHNTEAKLKAASDKDGCYIYSEFYDYYTWLGHGHGDLLIEAFVRECKKRVR